MKTVKDILYGVRILGVNGTTLADVNHLTFDSRTAKDGSMFFAIKGTVSDGHDFVQEAFDRGASVCMVSQDTFLHTLNDSTACLVTDDTRQGLWTLSSWWRGKFGAHIKVVGVTGSNVVVILNS